jgi:hypothetical protein
LAIACSLCVRGADTGKLCCILLLFLVCLALFFAIVA